jgi:Zn-dependent peptidase ImmA (M78 family)/DNA-binding XRE family transcriptional regulator
MNLRHNQFNQGNPQMVILARESRGLGQKALAEALGVSQGSISKIETGLIPLSDEMIEMLSGVLDYPPHFFRQEGSIIGIGIAEVFHRKRQSVPLRVLNRIYAQIEIRIKHISSLLVSVEIQSNVPKLDVDEYGGHAEEIARAVRAHWGMPRGPVQDVTKVVEDAGGIIIPFDFKTLLVDAISRWVPGLPPLFFVNERIPKDRYRLSLTHELGHMVMHTYPTPDIEEQAFRFAAEFLLPERDIIMDLHDLSLPKLANLKRYWKVSMAALLKRAVELNTIKPNQARYLWAQMAKAGYKTREPIELDVSGEQPHLLYELTEAHQKELEYSVEDVRMLIPLNDDELWKFYLQDPSHPRPRLKLIDFSNSERKIADK